MKYKLIPKSPTITKNSPEQHKEFALMDRNHKVAISRELQYRHIFLNPEDLLEVTITERNIYFPTAPLLDNPIEPQLPVKRQTKPYFIKANHNTSPKGMKVEM